nr:aminoacyl-tRNA hydrolase [Dehalococcoidales bacterium]
NGELGLSAGKVAAQTAHAALVLQGERGQLAAWAKWQAAGLPMALLRAPARLVRELVAGGQAFGVEDAGRTQTPSGSLTVAIAPPSLPADWPRDDATILATADARTVPKPR